MNHPRCTRAARWREPRGALCFKARASGGVEGEAVGWQIGAQPARTEHG